MARRSLSARDRKIAITAAIAGGVLLVALAFVLVWWITSPHKVANAPTSDITEATTTPEPSEEPTEGPASGAAGTPTTTPGPTAPPSGSTPAPPVSQFERLAYRQGQTLFVSDADGKNAAPVGTSPSGAFALSPDGRTIAIADRGALSFIDVDQKTVKHSIPIAEAARPVWYPDSGSVLVPARDASGERIMRVGRSDGQAAPVAPGASVAVSPDGGTVVIGPPIHGTAQQQRTLTVVRGSQSSAIEAPGAVTAVAATNERVIAAVFEGGKPSIWWWPRGELGAAKALVSDGLDAPVTTMMRSPSGSHLAFAVTGDDGYSRVSIVPSAGGDVRNAWLRKDNYALQWASDGQWLYLIEGNALQGEQTVLTRVRTDGTGRKILVLGASL